MHVGCIWHPYINAVNISPIWEMNIFEQSSRYLPDPKMDYGTAIYANNPQPSQAVDPAILIIN